jgi:hypothetical protein
MRACDMWAWGRPVSPGRAPRKLTATQLTGHPNVALQPGYPTITGWDRAEPLACGIATCDQAGRPNGPISQFPGAFSSSLR